MPQCAISKNLKHSRNNKKENLPLTVVQLDVKDDTSVKGAITK